MDFEKVVKNRRSVRDFKDAEISEDAVIKIIDAGRWAPSAGNAQDIRFIVIKDRNTKTKLAKAAHGQNYLIDAPVVIAVCSDPSQLGRKYGERGTDFYSLVDGAAAIQNMMLEAENLGIGSCWIGAFNDKEVKDVLMIPENVRVVGIIPLGYYSKKPHPPFKTDLHNVIFLEKWGKTG